MHHAHSVPEKSFPKNFSDILPPPPLPSGQQSVNGADESESFFLGYPYLQFS